MGVVSHETEISSTVPPSKLFKALAFDLNNILPEVFPGVVKSVELLEGDGGVGSIRQFNAVHGESEISLKEIIESIDEENLIHSYSVTEGIILTGKFEKIINEFKLEASEDGGTVVKLRRSFYVIGDYEITDEEIKVGNEMYKDFVKRVESYVLSHPNAYLN